MSAENVASMKKIMDIFGTGDVSGLESLIGQDVVDHQEMAGITTQGRERFKELVAVIRGAFPDMTIRVDDLIDGADRVVARSTMIGTNTTSFMGMPPTGRRIEVESMDIVRFENGMAVEHWGITEELKMMQQLGLVPTP